MVRTSRPWFTAASCFMARSSSSRSDGAGEIPGDGDACRGLRPRLAVTSPFEEPVEGDRRAGPDVVAMALDEIERVVARRDHQVHVHGRVLALEEAREVR